MKLMHSINFQRGDALIEALLGMLLMAIMGLGLAHSAARAVLSQRYVNTQNIMISDIRETLASSSSVSNLCGTTPSMAVAGAETSLDLTCTQASVTMALQVDTEDSEDEAVLSYTIAANSIVTSMDVKLEANDTNKSIIGGDGSMDVSY